jgi:hypothetical protein
MSGLPEAAHYVPNNRWEEIRKGRICRRCFGPRKTKGHSQTVGLCASCAAKDRWMQRVGAKWTRESAIEGLQKLAAELGRTPKVRDLNRAGQERIFTLDTPLRDYPSAATLRKLFGTTAKAMEAAGLPPVEKARPPKINLCWWCGAPFMTNVHAANSRWCSKRCRTRAGEARRGLRKKGRCEDCGAAIWPPHRYCRSHSASRRHRRRRERRHAMTRAYLLRRLAADLEAIRRGKHDAATDLPDLPAAVGARTGQA